MTEFVHFDELEGATPLTPEDVTGLIPTWVATRGDLNAAEQANIARAVEWASSARSLRSLGSLLMLDSMRELHERMFGEVWKWAGDFRRHGTNLGTDWPYITTELDNLLADVLAQTTGSVRLPWSPDELAIRFHHRLVLIHPFANGNGRHARLAADLLVSILGEPVFSWGANDLNEAGKVRSTYLDALRVADSHYDYESLVEFARS